FIDAAINDLVKEYDRNPMVFKNGQELPSDSKHSSLAASRRGPITPGLTIATSLMATLLIVGLFVTMRTRLNTSQSQLTSLLTRLELDRCLVHWRKTVMSNVLPKGTLTLHEGVEPPAHNVMSSGKLNARRATSRSSCSVLWKQNWRVVTRRESYDLDRQIRHDQCKDKGRRSARDRHHYDEPPSRLPHFPNHSLDNRQNPQSRHGRVPPIVRREDLYNPGLGGGNPLVNPQDWAAVDALMRNHGMTDSTFSPSITPGPETRLTTPSSDNMPGMCPTRTSMADLPDQAPAPALGSGTANGRTQGSSSTDTGASLCWVAAVVILITALVASDLSSLVLSQA
ncbi:hypothetical protein M405DRAFT_812002, partial [Rhizopogon salebrosus TDB-379]